MKLKKGIIILWVLFGISLFTTLILLKESSQDSSDYGEREAEPSVLEVYAWYDEVETFSTLAEGFMEKYPDIKVNLHYLPNNETTQSFQIILNGDEAVDVIAVATAAGGAQLIEKGQLADLREYLKNVDLRGLGSLMDFLDSEEGLYMLPYRNSAWVVYYNKKIFDEQGIPYPEGDWTWEEYADLAERLTNPQRGWYGSLNYESTWWRVPVRTAGAEDPMKEGDLNLFAEAAKWNYSLTYEKGAAMPYNRLTDMGSKDYIRRFLGGEAAMMYNGEWCLSMLRERMDSEYPDFQYDVAKLPCWDEEENYAIGSPAVLMVAEKSQRKEEAVLFLEYACGEEGAKKIAAKGFLPAWNSKEVRQVFQDSLSMPEHTEYFFTEEEISHFPSTTDYTISMNLLHDNIWSYFMKEISLETALKNYKEQLAERMVTP